MWMAMWNWIYGKQQLLIELTLIMISFENVIMYVKNIL